MEKIVLAKDITLYGADCPEIMPFLSESSIDLVLCDPSFGIAASQWDKIIPFPEMWKEIRRVRRENVPAVSFGGEPFSGLLRCGNLEEFKYDWVWEKLKASNFLLVKKQPLKAHELISVFGEGRIPYYPIMGEGEPYGNRMKRGNSWTGIGNIPNPTFRNENKGTRYPRSVIYPEITESEGKTIHANQKSVALPQYLIRIYTREGDTVLDLVSGGMSIVIACIYMHRKCICIKKDETYLSQGEKRARNEYQYLWL